jgi:hypothetical protein
MNNKADEHPVTRATRAVAEIKEEVQLAEWQKQIETRQSSGIHVSAWCERQGISKSTYYYHLRKVREYMCRATGILPKESPKPSKEQRGVPIRVAEEMVPEGRIEIISADS